MSNWSSLLFEALWFDNFCSDFFTSIRDFSKHKLSNILLLVILQSYSFRRSWFCFGHLDDFCNIDFRKNFIFLIIFHDTMCYDRVIDIHKYIWIYMIYIYIYIYIYLRKFSWAMSAKSLNIKKIQRYVFSKRICKIIKLMLIISCLIRSSLQK